MASVSPRTLASGEVRWRVQVRVKGQMKQTTFLEKKGADQYAAMIDRVGWDAAEQVRLSRGQRQNAAPTLREYTARYLDPHSGLLTGVEQGTRQGYEAEADRSFLQTLGEIPIDLVTKQDVGAWLAWQERQPVWRDRHKPSDQQKPVSSKTVRNYHALLSAIFKSAVDQGLRTDNPAFKVRVTRGTKRENVFLSPAEFETLLHFIPEKHQRFVLFLAGTGMRWGEATAVTWGDVALHGKPPTVRVTRAWKKSKGGPLLKYPKTSRSRRSVSLFPDLVAIMGAPGEADAFVFPNQTGGHLWHGPFNTRVWTPAVQKAMDADLCAELGLTPIKRAPTIHDMRHTHASWLIAQGIPLPYIQARLGHESITTTVNTYGHLVADAHDQMASAIAATLTNVGPRLSITQHAEP
ncbi:tyrosine integrase [Microbacterium phage Footloose]|uniref:Tyrosine integrase n=1 Tax=Microbacterium phage Footloose TaxID=2836048 RepID=A0A8F3E9R1_9CAUD|nr:tyrosine integrase [Microbacterium phage Footloose]QWY84613.1 tyrosine integrase [Microbacterium phage Footloose]